MNAIGADANDRDRHFVLMADVNIGCYTGTGYPKLSWQRPAADMICPDGVTFVDYSYFAQH